jgi:lycopene cyclase domain-containing protein
MSQYLYLILDLGSLSIPLLYSIFEKDFHFIKYLKPIVFSILLVAAPFLIWDAAFTLMGVWGFNATYHLPIKFIGMPVEEWLFFICIPYACLFTHEVLQFYLPKLQLERTFTLLLGVLLLLIIAVLLVFSIGKWYTSVNFVFFILLLSYGLRKELELLRRYFISFAVILLPFFLINGILTGSFIEEPVVWYNNSENLGVRLFTIPVEDVFYAFNMLFSVQLLFNYFKNQRNGNSQKISA